MERLSERLEVRVANERHSRAERLSFHNRIGALDRRRTGAEPQARVRHAGNRGSSVFRRCFGGFGWLLRLRCQEIGRHTSELQSLMRISYAVFCLKKKKQQKNSGKQQHKKQEDTPYKQAEPNTTHT